MPEPTETMLTDAELRAVTDDWVLNGPDITLGHKIAAAQLVKANGYYEVKYQTVVKLAREAVHDLGVHEYARYNDTYGQDLASALDAVEDIDDQT